MKVLLYVFFLFLGIFDIFFGISKMSANSLNDCVVGVCFIILGSVLAVIYIVLIVHELRK